MNINLSFANIIFVLATIITIYSILIFPILLNGNLSFNKNYKVINYNVKLFGFLKVLYGYFELDNEGIIVHLTKSKAILITFKDILSLRKKIKPLKDYHLFKFNSKLEIGAYGNDYFIEFASFYTFLTEMLGNIFSVKKPYFEVNSNVIIYEDSDVIKYSCKANLVFNLLMVVISAIKIIVEKIIYAIKNRTKQNKQCN